MEWQEECQLHWFRWQGRHCLPGLAGANAMPPAVAALAGAMLPTLACTAGATPPAIVGCFGRDDTTCLEAARRDKQESKKETSKCKQCKWRECNGHSSLRTLSLRSSCSCSYLPTYLLAWNWLSQLQSSFPLACPCPNQCNQSIPPIHHQALSVYVNPDCNGHAHNMIELPINAGQGVLVLGHLLIEKGALHLAQGDQLAECILSSVGFCHVLAKLCCPPPTYQFSAAKTHWPLFRKEAN